MEDPLEEEWQSTPVFLPGKSYGQTSLAGYSPRDCKESNTTEHAFAELHLTYPQIVKKKSWPVFPLILDRFLHKMVENL